jgi:two-component system phosphate regulon sensor histidine kinase PhoR
LQLMKPSARIATIFIFLFFLFFNGLQVYLIFQRIGGAKAKFNTACTNALLTTVLQYNRHKGVDTVPRPKQAFMTYSMNDIQINRKDSNTVEIRSPLSTLRVDSMPTGAVDAFSNRPRNTTIDLVFLDSIYAIALDTSNIHSKYRIDTFGINLRAPNARRDLPQMIENGWERKRIRGEYRYSTNPQRFFSNPNYLVFAEHRYDLNFFVNDLLWPMLAFFFILLISNTALVFVYKTIRRQKRSNELKTDFINNITHEMKTPITIASAGIEALEHYVSPTERTNFYLHTSKRQLHLLNEFVERILDAAVQDIPDFNLKKERLDLHALFGELVQSHSILQEKKVSFHLSGEGPVFIQGDRLHLETAFHNIIDNAIKYSNGSVDIAIDIGQNSRDCTIKIRDNGTGIPPQYIKNIFEKFFRVPQGDAQSVKGFGLGLYYVNSIVKKHSGNISVHSKPQSGTEFIITLPKNP